MYTVQQCGKTHILYIHIYIYNIYTQTAAAGPTELMENSVPSVYMVRDTYIDRRLQPKRSAANGKWWGLE